MCVYLIQGNAYWAIVGHNQQARTLVDGYVGEQSYRVNITYTAPLAAITKLADTSAYCKQVRGGVLQSLRDVILFFIYLFVCLFFFFPRHDTEHQIRVPQLQHAV